jgi:hypothetical protein
MNIEQDNVWTIHLPDSDLVFTRYLYIKDEVKINLLVSILQKNVNAVFWGYELYESGFKNEFFQLMWKIYYDFFASTNPKLESFILKKYMEWVTNKDKTSEIVSCLVNILVSIPFNNDVFMLRNICENFEVDCIYHNITKKIKNIDDFSINIEKWIETEDHRSISQFILNTRHDINLIDMYSICLNCFEKYSIKLTKNRLLKDFILILKIDVNPNLILLSKIMHLFSKKNGAKNRKSTYSEMEVNTDIDHESGINMENVSSYNVLKEVCKYGIDDFKHLSLFKLTRRKYDVHKKYCYNWEYHASFSPLWMERIKKYGGYVDYLKKSVVFQEDPNDDLMQKFYSNYGYEPDEQPKSIQDRSICKIEKKYDWNWFDKTYKNTGLVEIWEEELDEFNLVPLSY